MCPSDRSSTKIKRVVRSTLGADAAALSTGYDSAVHLRVLVARLLGLPGQDWATQARQIPKSTWIDCKSLEAMLGKTGASSTEKRVMLDVDDVRQFLEDEQEERRGTDQLKWTPTASMLADPMTKPVAASAWTALSDFLSTGEWKAQDVVPALFVYLLG